MYISEIESISIKSGTAVKIRKIGERTYRDYVTREDVVTQYRFARPVEVVVNRHGADFFEWYLNIEHKGYEILVDDYFVTYKAKVPA